MRRGDILENPILRGNEIAGSLEALRPGEQNVAIGIRLAESLGATVGSQISLISPQGRVTPFGTVPRIVAYNVAAIFEVGVYDYDREFVVMPIEDAQRSEETTSELQSLMRNTSPVVCLNKKNH